MNSQSEHTIIPVTTDSSDRPAASGINPPVEGPSTSVLKVIQENPKASVAIAFGVAVLTGVTVGCGLGVCFLAVPLP